MADGAVGQGRAQAAPRGEVERDAQGPEPRGVANARVVDLIRRDLESGDVELLMLEPRPWGSDPQQLAQLEAKLNAYLGYVQTGSLARDYPQYAGAPVRFRLECAGPPSGPAAQMLAGIRDFCANDGIAFEVAPRGATSNHS